MGDLIDFNEAKNILQMDESELQNLVTKGELRAFRSGGTMKFKRQDVTNFKKERETEPTIIIPAEQQGFAGPADAPPTEALQIDLPQDLGVDESAATVVPGGARDSGTEEIVFDDSDLEILPVDESDSAVTSEITVQEAAVGAPAKKAPRSGKAGRAARAAEEEAVEVEVEAEAGDEAGSGRKRASERLSGVASRRISAAYATAPGSPAFTLLLVATAALFIFIASVVSVILFKGYGYEKEGKYVMFVPGYLQGMYDSLKDAGSQQ